jgi:hypothetical protein
MAVNLVAIASNDMITGIAAASVDTLYTSTGVVTQINQITVANTTASPITMSFWILTSAQAATSFPATWVQIIAAGDGGSLDAPTIISGLLGQVIPSGGTLKACASTTDVTYVTASGIAIS